MGLFKKKNVGAPVGDAALGVPPAGNTPVGGVDNDDELIAVIAAAVAAYGAEQYRQTLYIQKLNRAAGIRPAWNVEGMMEAQDVRRI